MPSLPDLDRVLNRPTDDRRVTTLQAVELGVLGPLQARKAGAPVVIPGAKPRAVLTMLGLHGGSVVSADTLIELLWGDDPPRTAAKALQTHISSLRRTLGDGFVLTEGTGWTLADAQVDASRYKVAARTGRHAAAAGNSTEALASFEEALSLWRGIPELPDGRRGSSEKTRWLEAHAALVEDRADALLATGRAAEIVGELEAAISDAPLRERRWGQLMLALYRAGRQGEALGAYQRARSLLADQLGVDPGPELRRLEGAIVAQDAALDTSVAQHASSVTRAVTFLLTDIEGSTAAWEADAEAMAAGLARHDELVEQVVTSRGGRLIKTRGEGDATFSVFDRPSAAAAAAIELQDAIAREQWALREPLRIRVALHTGEVELRDGDYFGRAVNRAARLRSLAAGGQILCSGATAELVIDSLSDDIVLADLGVRQLRNLARPEHVFELRLHSVEDESVASQDNAPIDRPDLPAVLTGQGPFVGRGEELQRLSSTWQSSLSAGMRAVLIAGEPGVGKTRLAGEWSRLAYEQDAVVLYGRCDEDLGAPYQPFVEAIRSVVPCIGATRLRGLQGVEALLPLVPGLNDVLPDLAAPTRADPDTERYALFDAVVALLDAASASAPVVLILDDLHWAAKSTLLLLRHLLRFGDQARVQIVGTYRSTDLDRSHPLAAMLADLHRDGTAERLQLGGLGEKDVTTYVAEAGYDDQELGRALASVTGGNPFFLIEALRHVDESGGVWDQSTLPQGVREAVSRRLSRLPVETNKALAAAAVVGSRFAVDLVERVVDQDLVDAFDEACKAGIVIEEPGGRYRFNHALVRQSLLAELPSVRRMRLHQRIATTLENEPGVGDELLAELAHHYFECAWAGNAAKAVEFCRRAADQAMVRLAYEGAADLYDHALHALEEIDDELPDREDQTTELLVARCEALLAAGDVASAAGAVTQLQEATRDSARTGAWAACYDGQLSMLAHPERLDTVESTVSTAADTLAELGDAAGEAKAHTVRALCLARLGRIGDSEVALDRALTAARRARDHRRVNAVLAVAPLAALWGPNPVPRAGGRCLDVVRLLRITTDSPAVEATSTRCQAVLEAFRGRVSAAQRMIESARRTVSELGLRHAMLEVEQFAGIVELVVGDFATAEPYLRKAHNGFRRMGLDADTAETAALLGRACLALDRDAEADELCSESERLAGHALKASIAWRTLRAQLLSRRGAHDGARRAAKEAIALAERTDALVDHGDACLALATALGAAGDAAGSRAAAGQAIDLYERKGAAALAERARLLIRNPEVSASTPSTQPGASLVNGRGPAIAELDAAQTQSVGAQPQDVRLESAATHLYERFKNCYASRDWDALSELVADDICTDDRRRVVNAGLQSGREAVMAEILSFVELGAVAMSFDVIATRGDRLILNRSRIEAWDQRNDLLDTEVVEVIEVDAVERLVRRVLFDSDDIERAFDELDARYIAGEAAAHAHTWSAIADTFAAANRRELSATTPDWINVDHRRMTAFAPGSADESLRAMWDLAPNFAMRIETVHRLTDLGAVVTYAAHGESQDGFDAEWRHVNLFTVDGDLLNRCEIFDETDLDAALARFKELHPQERRLENTAARVSARYRASFAARDWAAIEEQVGESFFIEDRTPTVNAGIRRGRDAELKDLQAAADVGFTHLASVILAIRGEQLVLASSRFAKGDDSHHAFENEILHVTEIDADERMAAVIVFDADDIDAAVEELDARYVAGEAAAHADTWSLIAGAYTTLNQGRFPPSAPDYAIADHRLQTTILSRDFAHYMDASWNLTPDLQMYVEAVHRLSDDAAVMTHGARGSSPDDFEADWRIIVILTFEGGLAKRCEIFDEADLDKALARFDELHPRPRKLENAASRSARQYLAHYAARDWDSMAEALADAIITDDRRRVVGAGLRRGRDAAIVDQRVIADLGSDDILTTVVAIRGEHLSLLRTQYKVGELGQETVNEILSVVETDSEDRIAAHISFDADDFVVAIAELESRYLAGDAAACARTWSAIIEAHTAFNRRELPSPKTDLIDHRPVVTARAGKPAKNIRDMWEFTPDLKIHIESVHRLSERGAVVTQVSHGTSQAGFEAEWRDIELMAVEGDRVRRCEVFGEGDLDAAIAQFENLPPQKPRLENAATRVADRYASSFTSRDWAAMAELITEDFSIEDRRPTVNAGIRHGRDAGIREQRAVAEVGFTDVARTVLAIRGEHLALVHAHYTGSDEGPEPFEISVLHIVEIASERVTAVVTFDTGDIEAAVEELDARYLAGEAAQYSQTWTAVCGSFTALNRRELPDTAGEIPSIDHRRAAAYAPGELIASVRAGWDLGQAIDTYIEAVHRLDDFGVVVTHAARGTSDDGFDAEWRGIDILTIEGDRVSRCELFDDRDLNAALAQFDELAGQKPPLDSAATRIWTQLSAAYNRRDLDDFMSLTTRGGSLHDRRKGLQSVSTGQGRRKNLEAILVLSPASWRMSADTIAVRGSRLSLSHIRWNDVDAVDSPTSIELLAVTELDDNGLLHDAVSFDVDNTEAAFAELEARYLAGEAAPHAGCWSAITGICSTLNGQELPETTAGWVSLDHRRAASTAPGDWTVDIRAAWQQAPDIDFHISAVHRLSGVGTVITGMADGTSREGFEAEWRLIALLMVDDDKLSRIEVFDEGDLDAALARFEELQSKTRPLTNAATEQLERFRQCYSTRDWDAIAETVSLTFFIDDRRRAVNSGLERGRDAVIERMRATADLDNTYVKSTTVATRGERLVLTSASYSRNDQGSKVFRTELLSVVETDADGKLAAQIVFDPDDVDAAFAELEARYLAGEAAGSAVWSEVSQSYAAMNRHKIPATMSNWTTVDHRVRETFDGGNLAAYTRSAWDLIPDVSIRVETVHRLTDRGAVATHVASGTSEDGFEAEWRMIVVLVLRGEGPNRCELFSEADLNTALARLDEI
jgi:DNA-binding SARP family transcriptional activator